MSKLHLVFGGRVKDPQGLEFTDLDKIDLIGLFDSYAAAQRDVDALWGRKAEWNAKAIRNVAGMGWFSSDRTIRQYASEIWGVL